MDDQGSQDYQSQESGDVSSITDQNAILVEEDEDDPTLLTRREVRQGSLPGNTRVRIVLPSHRSFRRLSTGVLEATELTQAPPRGLSRAIYTIKRVLIGAPLTTAQAEHERLTKFKALAVLSSDAISSVAYATEAILITLVAAGSGNLGLTLPISFAIVALLAIVAISYRQTIPAYPNGGGSYIVAKDNLGTLPGLVAAASLLIDYVLTVSVSISSGVQNLASLFTGLSPYVVIIDVVLVIFVTIVNLRGVRESGSIFAIPTYIFIASALLLIIVGLVKSFFVQHNPVIGHFQFVASMEPLTLFLILKSFAAGCSAMTGVEAISNGVPAFKKPEPRNAATTLTWMAVILGTLFIGITILATSYHVEANTTGNPTVIAQIATQVFTGPLFFMFPVFQLATLFILTLAANTSYSDFPRLASLLARDKFLPGQFAFRGDRLAFSTGIIFLAVLASLLLVVFKGNTTQLINLYAVGVFMSFTLSQSGMVRHWWRLRREHKGWLRSMVINGLGALTTLLVSLVISSTKFLEGAWIVVVLIPLLVLMFLSIHRHYQRVERERVTDIPIHPKDIRHRLIVPIAGLDRAAIQSLAYARSITPHVTAVHIAVDMNDANQVQNSWQQWQKHLTEDEETHLIIIESPYRSLMRPLLAYIDTVHELFPNDTLTVILPEFVVAHWWEHLLHNQTALRLKASLLFRPGIVVTSVPQHLRSRIRS
jgi:amino acid transporter